MLLPLDTEQTFSKLQQMSAPIPFARPAHLQLLRQSLPALRQNLSGVLLAKGIGGAALRLAEVGSLGAEPAPVPALLGLAELAGRLVEVTAPEGPRSAAAGAQKAGAGTSCAGTSCAGTGWAGTSWAAAQVAAVHRQGETAAWVVCAEAAGQSAPSPANQPVWSLPYAPDLQAYGVDLAALPFVRAANPAQVLQAADVLLRSGAFGLVVVDWPTEWVSNRSAGAARPTDGALGRLLGLCQRHEAALVFLAMPHSDAHNNGHNNGHTNLDSRPKEGSAGDTASTVGGHLGSLIGLRLEVWREADGLGNYTLHTAVRKDKRHGSGLHLEARRAGPMGAR